VSQHDELKIYSDILKRKFYSERLSQSFHETCSTTYFFLVTDHIQAMPTTRG